MIFIIYYKTYHNVSIILFSDKYDKIEGGELCRPELTLHHWVQAEH